MAKQTNVVEYRIRAVDDGASAAFNRAARNAQQAVRQTTMGYDMAPRMRQYRSADEQAFRNEQAAWRRGLRQQEQAALLRGGDSLNMGDFNRGTARWRPGATGGALADITRQTRQLNSLMRAGGALMVADMVGNALQKIPETAEKFRKSLENGGSRTGAVAEAMADLLPGVGSLARGFRSMIDYVMEPQYERRNAERRQQRQENAAMRDEILQRREAVRDPIRQAGAAMGREADAILRLSGKRGMEREREELRIAYDEELRQIAELEREKGKLSLDEQNKLGEQLSRRRLAAQSELNQKLQELDNRQFEAEGQAQRRHVETMAQERFEARQRDLQEAGKQDAARRDAIEHDYQQQLTIIERGLQEQLEAVKGNALLEEQARRRAGEQRSEAERRKWQDIEASNRQRDREAKAKREEEEQKRAAFAPSRAGVFVGESRLLSGVAGLGNDPNRKTADATTKSEKHLEKLTGQMGQLVAALQSGQYMLVPMKAN
jgi:hypothetical protein